MNIIISNWPNYMDLSKEGVQAYWVDRGTALYDILTRMAELQDWAVDKDLEKWILALSEALENPACIQLMADRPKETAEFLSWLSSPVALRIMNAVDEVQLGAAAQIVFHAEEMAENPIYRLFIEGLEVLSRSRLLAHVFSPDRMALVEAAVKSARKGVAA